MAEGVALVKGESTRDCLTTGGTETQTTVAALATRTDGTVTVNDKRAVLARLHLSDTGTGRASNKPVCFCVKRR